jgi:hypothetical protein
MNTLCSDEFEDSFDVCGKYSDGSLHLHGVLFSYLEDASY